MYVSFSALLLLIENEDLRSRRQGAASGCGGRERPVPPRLARSLDAGRVFCLVGDFIIFRLSTPSPFLASRDSTWLACVSPRRYGNITLGVVRVPVFSFFRINYNNLSVVQTYKEC